MASGLIDIMKRASMDAMDNKQMCDLRFGTVTSVTPLKVQITNQFTIPEKLLIVPRHLTNYKVEMLIDGVSRSVEVKNALVSGDKVALIRKTGGQSYYILDRI